MQKGEAGAVTTLQTKVTGRKTKFPRDDFSKGFIIGNCLIIICVQNDMCITFNK